MLFLAETPHMQRSGNIFYCREGEAFYCRGHLCGDQENTQYQSNG